MTAPSAQEHQTTIETRLTKKRLVPVIVLDRAEDAAPLAESLIQGGLPVAEITMRTPAALDAMKIVSQYPDVLLGAGTVCTAEQVDQAVDCGANYIISPGMHEEVIERCFELNVLAVPGVITPSDIAKAMSYGLDLLKFFPAEAFGGAKTLKAMSAPYSHIRFVPTGGIHASNVTDYLNLPSVAACGGSWMVDRNLIKEGKFDRITELVHDALTLTHPSHSPS